MIPPFRWAGRPRRTLALVLGGHRGPLLAYIALGAGITWPLVLRLGSAVPHDAYDPVAFAWILWWNAQALPLTPEWLNAPIFFPSTGAMVFQDSLLGVWPLTTAVQWAGASPLATHNLLVIGSFAASAFTAYLLCVHLFADRPAAFTGGVVFGFALYRMAQLPHVNVLLTFWVPLILLGLHRYLAERRSRWLMLAASCWALQGLTSGYFLAYSSVLVALWALFFLRRRLRDCAKVALSFAVALAAIWPWLGLYRLVHAQYGFRRTVAEAEFFSADVVSLFKAPQLLAIWGGALGESTREDQLFPGITLACTCLAVVAGSRYWSRPSIARSTGVFLGLAAAFAGLAAIAAFQPVSFEVFGVQVRITRPYKPLSLLWLSLALAFVTSLPVQRILRAGSVAGFYALAALAMWVFSLGPTARFMGERIWYKAPYSWLLAVPGGDSLRVPARFWMLAVLALAIVVAHGIARLRLRAPGAARVITPLVCAGLVSEAWLAGLPLPAPPERFDVLESRSTPLPVLELPLGDPARDIAAMYRSIYHRAPTVNGYSAYAPQSFVRLRVGLEDGDPAALVPYAEVTALDILVHTSARNAAQYQAVVEHAGATLTTARPGLRLYRLARRRPVDEPPPSEPAPIASLTDAAGGNLTAALAGDDPFSGVVTPSVDVRLAKPCTVDEVQLAAAPNVAHVDIGRSDGERRDEVWSGGVAERSVRAALVDPRLPYIRLRFAPTRMERLQVRLRGTAKEPRTAIQGVRVLGAGCSR